MFRKKAFFFFCALLLALWASPALALKNMLIYGPTAGCYADSTPGFNVTVWTTAQWAAATTAQFAAFDVIVFADCSSGGPCFTDPTIWNTAIANESVWSPAIKGNIFIIGSDPDHHGQQAVVQQAVTFAAGASTGTGLYVALSCVYQGSPVNTSIPLLLGFGSFMVEGAENGGICSNNEHIIATSPALIGITDSTLSSWGCSVHEGFDSWPAGFTPLAIALDTLDLPYSAPDGTQGLVYILAEGVTPVPSRTPTPTPTVTPTPTKTSTPTMTPTPTPTFTPCGYPGNTCTPTNTPTPTATPYEAFYVSKNIFNAANQQSVSIFVSFSQYPGHYDLSIYNSAGEFITNLDNNNLKGGFEGSYSWNGTNKNGEKCASGVYIIYLIEPTSRKFARVLLIR
jgi:hypothetical protein